jgi:hypothetical protein
MMPLLHPHRQGPADGGEHGSGIEASHLPAAGQRGEQCRPSEADPEAGPDARGEDERAGGATAGGLLAVEPAEPAPHTTAELNGAAHEGCGPAGSRQAAGGDGDGSVESASEANGVAAGVGGAPAAQPIAQEQVLSGVKASTAEAPVPVDGGAAGGGGLFDGLDVA